MNMKPKLKITKRKPKAKRKGKPVSRPSPTSVDAIGSVAGEIHNFRQSILYFIKVMWGLIPQEPLPEYKEAWEAVMRAEGKNWLRLKETVRAEWFGHGVQVPDGYWIWSWHGFTKGSNLTWQQTLILLGVEKATRSKDVSFHISVRSGHGIGKSATMTWIVLWFLYCYFQAQVPVTAPTSGQMHDVLWKELSLWINRIKNERVREVFDWKSDYIRMKHDPETWFARAKTSSKENTEALAGVHSEHVLIAVDEASGVPEQVYNTAEGALTSGNVGVVMISNPTRVIGYFFDSHHKNSEDWQTFHFNCEQSPVVDSRYVRRQAKRHGVESDEYRIRVLGQFPSEDMMDDSGYLQLIPRTRINVEPSLAENDKFIGKKFLAIDPSGEGDDECEFVLRDSFRAKNILTLNTTNDAVIAENLLTFIDRYNLKTGDIVIEGFGIGVSVAKRISKATKGKIDVYIVLPGNRPTDESKTNAEFFVLFESEVEEGGQCRFLNLRSLMHFRMRDWIMKGGRVIDNNVENSDFAEQLASGRYKRSLQGNKVQMMSKQEMNKLRIKSPNKNDALALTFLLEQTDGLGQAQSSADVQAITNSQNSVDDRFGVL